MSSLHRVPITLVLLAVISLASAQHHHPHHAAPAAENGTPALERTAAIHGRPGPFAVAGYQMGEAALRTLGLPRGSFDLEVIHYSPQQVQWSCIADGLQAATGVSAGKLNLRLVPTEGEVYSVVRNRKTGRSLRFELADTFIKDFKDLPPEKLTEAGSAVVKREDAQVFRIAEVAAP